MLALPHRFRASSHLIRHILNPEWLDLEGPFQWTATSENESGIRESGAERTVRLQCVSFELDVNAFEGVG